GPQALVGASGPLTCYGPDAAGHRAWATRPGAALPFRGPKRRNSGAAVVDHVTSGSSNIALASRSGAVIMYAALALMVSVGGARAPPHRGDRCCRARRCRVRGRHRDRPLGVATLETASRATFSVSLRRLLRRRRPARDWKRCGQPDVSVIAKDER